jgi:proton glutamate symport protein
LIRGGSSTPAPSVQSRSRLPGLTTQIFIGLLLGIVVGYLWPGFGVAVKPLADAFLRMIKMIIAPLVFATLVVGIAGTGDLKAMGRIGVKAIIYFEIATTIALFLGLALVNIFKPGAGLAMPIGADTSAAAAMAQNQQHAWDIFLHLFPTSVIDAMARGDILQLVVFSTFFGIALAAIGPKGQPVLDVLESTAQAMFKFTGYVMAFAPVGVFAAIAATVGGKGLAILFTLGKLIALMYLGLAIFVVLVVGGVSYLIRVPFFTFVKAIREPFLIAFTTASSEAALPKALEVM